MAYDTEQDSISLDAPPSVVAPPETVPPPPASAVVPPSTPWSTIDTAAGQLNAGQPVTALPRQSWTIPEQNAFNARLDAFDQQAKAARAAAQNAALDAQMFDQMSRVAKSTKDIEIAKRSIDMMGLQRDIQNGVPIHEAVARHPMALGSGFSGALRATVPVAAPKWVPPAGGAPGYVLDPRGTPHFPPGMEPMMPTTPPEDIGGGVKVVRVSPQHLQVLDTGAPKKLPLDVAQEVSWRNADIKAAQTQKANLLKAGTRANSPDILKLDQLIEEQKNAVRAVQKPAEKGAQPVPVTGAMPTPKTKQERDALPTGTRYVGPDGRTYIKK